MTKKEAELKRIREAYEITMRGLSLAQIKRILRLEYISDDDVMSYDMDDNNVYHHMTSRFFANDERMKKWQLDQVARMGAEGVCKSVNLPLAIELSHGCSKNCSFCALSAQRLDAVYRATDENMREFEAVLDLMEPILGAGAKDPLLFYATEPLDNPDYFYFASLVRERSGYFPQISTTQYLRRADELRTWLPLVNQDANMVHRFSVLSENDLLSIYDTYSPDELFWINIQPRWRPEELYTCGRNNGLIANTIACVSGFIINMASHTVRIESPTMPTYKAPNGYNLFYSSTWRDIDELKWKVNSMIENL